MKPLLSRVGVFLLFPESSQVSPLKREEKKQNIPAAVLRADPTNSLHRGIREQGMVSGASVSCSWSCLAMLVARKPGWPSPGASSQDELWWLEHLPVPPVPASAPVPCPAGSSCPTCRSA